MGVCLRENYKLYHTYHKATMRVALWYVWYNFGGFREVSVQRVALWLVRDSMEE